MKNLYYVIAILLFFNFNANGQFSLDFENCDTNGGVIDLRYFGDDFPCDCIDGTGCFISCSSTQVHTGNWSGLIPGDNSSFSVVKLGDKIFGQWGLEFWMYIPSNKEAFFNIQGESIVCPGFSAVGDVFFNKGLGNEGVGVLEESNLGDVFFNFPHNQWFNVVINVDISFGMFLATWKLEVDCIEVIPEGTPFANGSSTVPASLGALLFSSVSQDNELYIDDFSFISGNMDCLLGINDLEKIKLTIYPNPSENVINIETQDIVRIVVIYNLQGMRVKELTRVNSIDVSSLSAGLYFVAISTETGRTVRKFIKK